MRTVVEYLDDNREESNPRLRILWNHDVDGDIYISIRTDKEMSDSIRLCASGGAQWDVPGLRLKFIEAFKLISKHKYNEEFLE